MPSERELMQMLQVGRSTVREALKGLEVLGLVEIRHGQGAYVKAPTILSGRPFDLAGAMSKGVTLDLLEARIPVELEVARLAPQRRTSTDVSDLASVIRDH